LLRDSERPESRVIVNIYDNDVLLAVKRRGGEVPFGVGGGLHSRREWVTIVLDGFNQQVQGREGLFVGKVELHSAGDVLSWYKRGWPVL
jgi:hypothetical protein